MDCRVTRQIIRVGALVALTFLLLALALAWLPALF